MWRFLVVLVLFTVFACESSKKEPELIKCPIVEHAGDTGEIITVDECISRLEFAKTVAQTELYVCRDVCRDTAVKASKPTTDIEVGPDRLDFDFGFYCLRGRLDHQPEWADDFRNKVNNVPGQNYASVEDIKTAFEEVDDYFKCKDVFRRIEEQNFQMEKRDTGGKIIAEYTVDPKRIEQRKRVMALRAARVLFAAVSVPNFPRKDYFVITACDGQVSCRRDLVHMMVDMLLENGLKPSDVKRGLTSGHLVKYYKRGEKELRAHVRAQALEDLGTVE